MRKPPLPPELRELPVQDDALVYVITDEISALPEYGRLLRLINYFRLNGQFRVRGDASDGIIIEGPTSIAQIEKRFLLPHDLAFHRRNKFSVSLIDGEMRIEFRPKSSIWMTVGSHEFYDGRDSLTGDHTQHWD